MENSDNPKRVRIEDLRSQRWLGGDTLRSFGHRSRTKQMGYSEQDYAGKPVIGIVNTFSDLNPCHMHFRTRAEEIKRGVWQAGGFPVELPAMSITESYMKPSPMLYRNLLAMEVEELLWSQPVDGAVLMGGCDKTIPALVMGALSVDMPTILVPAGPMLRGNWRGQTVGSGSDVWKCWSERRAGNLSDDAWNELENGIARSFGHCMTMGTASTMTSAMEAMGWILPGGSSIPAADSSHARMATDSGRRAVDMVWEDLRPSRITTVQALENAITTVMALGGSTNAVIHLTAIAGRAGLEIPLSRFDEISRTTPMLADIQPSGRYLMEDFFYAGGLTALLSRMSDRLHLNSTTVAGTTLGDNLEGAECFDDDVIRTREDPVSVEGGLAVLTGNLAPNGCVLKQTAATEELLRHVGPAVVFKDYDDLEARIDDPELDVTAESVLVLQNAGPVGGPGMPEWGMLPIPKKLLEQGVRDMVRISDARMSGTSFGTCVLHVSPESAVGGTLGLVRDGDIISLDVPARRVELRVSQKELDARRADWQPPEPSFRGGYRGMYLELVTQADRGCDFESLVSRHEHAEPAIH